MRLKVHKPRALKPGDTVAVVRPASHLDVDLFDQSIQNLRSLGFCVVLYPKKFSRDGVFAASDEMRAKELHWAFSEPGIKAVLAARGGYGSIRTFSHLSKADMKKWKPKLFVGYSDTTYIHQYLQNELGWATVHGPLIGSLSRADLRSFMRDVVELPSKPSQSMWKEVKNIGANKKARGKLVGGNLSLLQLVGRAALPTEPVILALEDIQENHYRLDRMIWNLIDADYGRYVRGIVLGTLHECGAMDRTKFPVSRVYETLKKLCRGPIWTGAHFGHGLTTQRLLPLGCQVELHGRQFKILESVVSRDGA